MRGVGSSSGVFAKALVCALAFTIPVLMPRAAAAEPCVTPNLTYADQGWTATDRDTFYTTGEGSHLIPYAFFKALRRTNVDAPFAADQLQRYGYLCNDSAENTDNLPIGFVVDRAVSPAQIGMTCAACHTGQVEYQKGGESHVMRIDGAPGKVDNQQFVTDLLTESRATLNQSARFAAFANAAIAAGYPAADAAALRVDFQAWVDKFGDFMDHSLPAPPAPSWGPGRIDAFGMIFDRVTALDLVKPGNYQHADAPVKYPFLWNAWRQDHTQWNGKTPNGLSILALARNVGQVLGVFGEFTPRLQGNRVDYSANSVNLDGLRKLEEKIDKLKPPKWPFAVDMQLAHQGRPLYETWCGNCHDKRPSPSLGIFGAWDTPRKAVGTDPKTALNALRDAPDPGVFNGQLLPPPNFGRFGNPAKANDIVVDSVIGIILEGATFDLIAPSVFDRSGVSVAPRKKVSTLRRPGDLLDGRSLLLPRELQNLIRESPPLTTGAAYEARVLCGIWAAAPYLHNGSVPNLRELLTTSGKRQARFQVGSRVYDPDSVGYAIDNSPFANGTFVADPQNANGNGNAGHEFGTNLSEREKAAIIEYLKTLDSASPDC